jgi:hypothetical protein
MSGAVPLPRSLIDMARSPPIWSIDPEPEPSATLSTHQAVTPNAGQAGAAPAAHDGVASPASPRVETIYLDTSPIDEKCGLLIPRFSTGIAGSPTDSNLKCRPAWLWGSRPAKDRVQNGKEQQQCCKELKGDDERHLVNPAVVRDV